MRAQADGLWTREKAKKGRRAQCSRCSAKLITEGGEMMTVVPGSHGGPYRLQGTCPQCGANVEFKR